MNLTLRYSSAKVRAIDHPYTKGIPDMTVIVERNQPGCILQIAWFIFVGWWATGLWISAAWFLCALIVTLPFGALMLNNVPKVLALREPGGDLRLSVVTADGQLVSFHQQRPFILRALYFLLIGCWWSAIVIGVAYFFALTIIGLPLAFWLFDYVPAAVTLRR
jgi:uncharacterized membrane protein YccF (DUF307 family)